jgi:carboxymethylenebutenolidase
MVETWERHMAGEFDSQSIEQTMATMTAHPSVNHVPVMTGGTGAHEVREFYTRYFIGRHPPDTTIVPVTRTVGESRIIDELTYQFTHTIEMPWMLPGILPTGRRVEVALVVAVDFVDGRSAQSASIGTRPRSSPRSGCSPWRACRSRGLRRHAR